MILANRLFEDKNNMVWAATNKCQTSSRFQPHFFEVETSTGEIRNFFDLISLNDGTLITMSYDK